MESNVHIKYNGAMRFHITLNEKAMIKLRRMAKTAKCEGKTDRELLQAYLHYIAGEPQPQWGGQREGAGVKPKKAKKKPLR